MNKMFRGIGEHYLGKEVMDKVTDDVIEKARCDAFSVLANVTKVFGKQPKGTLENLFIEILTDRI